MGLLWDLFQNHQKKASSKPPRLSQLRRHLHCQEIKPVRPNNLDPERAEKIQNLKNKHGGSKITYIYDLQTGFRTFTIVALFCGSAAKFLRCSTIPRTVMMLLIQISRKKSCSKQYIRVQLNLKWKFDFHMRIFKPPALESDWLKRAISALWLASSKCTLVTTKI